MRSRSAFLLAALLMGLPSAGGAFAQAAEECTGENCMPKKDLEECTGQDCKLPAPEGDSKLEDCTGENCTPKPVQE